MTTPTPSRLLDFFTLEATEYLSRIKAAVSQAPAPDAAGLKAGARGLRGSATMARAGGIAKLAGRVEIIATKLTEGDLTLTPPLHRVLASTAETLVTLVRSVRVWRLEHDERVRAALAELDSYSPAEPAEAEDVIVPISGLFYSDAGPHVVEVAPSARTTFEHRLREKQATSSAVPVEASAPAPRTPPASHSASSGAGLRGAALRDALGSSLARMRSLERPGEPPAAQPVVRIETLLYRGPSAVMRAKELRAQILNAMMAPSREVFAELCDLVELASAE